MHVSQEHAGGRRHGRKGVRMGHNIVALQEGHGVLDAAVCLLLMWIDTHDMHLLRALQLCNLEHLQSTSRVHTPIIRHNYYMPFG